MKHYEIDPTSIKRLGVGGRALRSPHVIATFCALFLLLQLIAPALQLICAPRPARFGWQMFSVSAPPPDFIVERQDRTRMPIDIKPYVLSLRGDVPLAQFLPPHLCQVLPGIVAVHYRFPGAQQSESYQCKQ